MKGNDRFQPTAGMISAAKRGLELRRENGRGGTVVGIARARDIANGRSFGLDTIRRMHSFFSRHAFDKTSAAWKDKSKVSNGRIAWLLWGGDAGATWSKSIRDRAEKVGL